MRRIRVAAFLITVAAAPPSAVLCDTLIVAPVAVSRQTAPVGGRYVLFGNMNIDSLRRVTFTASLSRGQVGIFRTTRDVVTPLVLTGDDAPDDAGTAFDTLLDAASNARGDLAFISTLFFPRRAGVFLMRDGVITTLALEGAPAPTRRGEFFGSFDQIRILDSGDVYFGASLTDGPFSTVPAGRAIVKASDGALEGIIAPGDGFMGEREIAGSLEFHVNEDGEISTLAEITSADLLQGEERISEILLYSSGKLMTVASVNLPISSAGDTVRNFAITFDQVRITPAGAPAFFAATNDLMHGAYFINRTRLLLGNEKLIGQGDPSALSPTDRFDQFGAFGIDEAEDLIFHATSMDVPQGGIFFRRDGAVSPVALAGQTRPDGTDVYHGFQLVAMNESGAFAFTDFQDRLVQVGIFQGRLIPAPGVVVGQLADEIRTSGLPRPLAQSLMNRVQAITRLIARDAGGPAALKITEALRRDVRSRAGRAIPGLVAERLDLTFEDLIISMGGDGQPAGGSRRPRLVPE